MNIQMRLITEENVDQLLNLSYQSQNIEHLLHIEETIPNNEIYTFLSNYKKQLNNKINKIDEDIKNDKKKQDEIVKDNLQELESEPVSVESNSLTPGSTLEYAPGSPAYMPEFNTDSNSNDSNYYNPNSYNPNSYNPNSYNPNSNPNPNNSLDFENVNYIKPNNQTQTLTATPIQTHTLTATPIQTQTLTATPIQTQTHTLTATPEEKNNDILNIEEPTIQTQTQTDSDNKTESQADSTKKIIIL
jgi:hypothetical protein